jgi:beta-N-acetylhexosaminidase
MKAGADVLLQPFPQDIPGITQALLAAVQSGELSQARVDAAVRRILELKARLGLHRAKTVDLNRLADVVGKPEHLAIAQDAADRSITVAQDAQKLLPLKGRVLNVIYSDDYDPFAGRLFNQQLRAVLPDTRTLLLDANAGVEEIRALAGMADSADVVIFAPFIRVRAAKDDLALPGGIAAAINAVAARKPTIVTAFGNPYVRAQLADVGTYVLAWGQTDVVQRAAARALTGQIPIVGKLPIDIPPFYRLGEGIVLQR